jgi:WD40 repeat protein
MVRRFEPSRALEVIQPKYGSAYRIGGRLVLTAAHILDEVGSACRIRAKQSFGETEAIVVWKTSQTDIALIELPQKVEPCEAIVFGLLPNSINGEKLEFQMYGYPRWGRTQREQGAAAGGRQVEGIIYLSDISPDGLLVLEAFRVPEGSLDSGSDWEGNSGAAIICDDLLIGVLRQHQNPKRPASLEASPLSTVYSDQKWCDFLKRHGINPEPAITPIQNQVLDVNSKIDSQKLLVSKEFRRNWGDSPENFLFFGRAKHLTTLKRWLVDEQCRSISILGMGGIGKTALAKQISSAVQEEFDYVIWRSLREAPPIEKILSDIIRFLSNNQEINLSDDLSETIDLLIERYLKRSRSLIILDNAESIMERGNLAGQYKKKHVDYRLFFNAIGVQDHSSCLLLTSREKPQNIKLLSNTCSSVQLLELEGLNIEESRSLFINAGVDGSREELEAIFRFYGGNPLFLDLAARHITEFFQGDIFSFHREAQFILGQPLYDIEDEREDIRKMLDWYFGRFSPEQKEIVYWFAIEREPVSIAGLTDNILSTSSREKLLNNLESLQRLMPIERNEDGKFTLQPVLIEYATDRLVEEVCNEIRTGNVSLLSSHALLKAQSADYIREAQVNFILEPIVRRFDDEDLELEERLNYILTHLTRKQRKPQSSYAAGNILNLFCHTDLDVGRMDRNFSHLAVWQADLQGVTLNRIDFSYSSLLNSMFTQSMGIPLCIRFSPNGQCIALGDSHWGIYLLQSSNGQPLWHGTHNNDIWSVAFTPDGDMLASADEGGIVRLWSVQTGHCLRTISRYIENPGAIYSLMFDHTGKTLAAASKDKAIRIWNVDTLLTDETTDQPTHIFTDHAAPVMSIAFPSREPEFETLKYALVSSGYDRKVRLFDIKNKDCQELYEHNDWVWSVAFSPFGKWIASGSKDCTVIIWNVDKGEIEAVLREPTNMVLSLTFSPDEQTLAIGGADGTIRLWSIQQGQYQNLLSKGGCWIRAVDFTPDGEQLISCDDGAKVQVWDIKSNNRLKTWQGHVNAVRAVVIPDFQMYPEKDSRSIISCGDDSLVREWDYQTGECTRVLDKHDGWVWALACSPDGKWLASGTNVIKLRNTQNDELYELEGHKNGLWEVTFSPDSRWLASCSYDKTVKIWNVPARKCLVTLAANVVPLSIAFNPSNNSLAFGGDDYKVKLWKIKNAGDLRENNSELLVDGNDSDIDTIFEHQDIVRSVCFNSTGTLLASSSDDCTVALHNLATKQSSVLRKHTSSVYALSLSPDGKWLASAGADNIAILWDVEALNPKYLLRGHIDSIWSITFSADSQLVFSGSQDGTIKIWDVNTGREALEPLIIYKPYDKMNITGVELNNAVKSNLKALGAIEF